MKFEENSHCTLEERMILVASEIKKAYPNIGWHEALQIAALDEPINRKADNDIKFMRYYYMLLVLHENNDLKYNIYNELVKITNLGLIDDKLINVMDEINKYMSNKREDFPIISEIYGY